MIVRYVLVLIIVVSLCLLAYTPSSAEWHQFQGNVHHTGNNPDRNITPPLEHKWSRLVWWYIEGQVLLYPVLQPTVVDDRVFISWGNYIWCFDIQTPTEKWRVRFQRWVTQPSYSDGLLYCQVDVHTASHLTALNIGDGSTAWRSNYMAQWDAALAPAVSDGKVVICGEMYGGTHCFDASTGKFLWKNSLQDHDKWTPALWNDRVYTFERWDYWIADLQTGGSIFGADLFPDTSSCQTKDGGSAKNSPVLDTLTGIVYVTSDESLHAIDLETNEVIWWDHGECRFQTTPALYNGRIYSVQEGRLKALDALTGDSLGVFVGEEDFWWNDFFAPVAGNGYVYVSSEHWVYALDAETLEEVWRYNVGGHLALGNDHLFVGSKDSYLHVFEQVATDVTDQPDPSLPMTLVLHQNYPNPFNNSTIISYDLPTRSHVEISVYNILGRRVATVHSGLQPAGTHSIEWNGTDDLGQPVSSGTYFYRIKTDDLVRTKKMILLK